VLLVVQHPAVGAGFEMLLRLEGRFDITRVTSVDDADRIVAVWQPDVVLVDGMLLREREHGPLGAPCLVLTGSDLDGAELVRTLDDARGWLRKDPTPRELVDAIDDVRAVTDRGFLALRSAV
jgi:DNA-binding NarL/FixJ family response regulator